MHKGIQKRTHERHSARCQFRLLTSVSRISYAVEVTNISLGGAFVITDHIPPLSEVVSIEVMDNYGRKLFSCSAKVVNFRSVSNEFGSKRGFGVQFTTVLTQDQVDQLAS